MTQVPNYPDYYATEEGKIYRYLKNGDVKEIIGTQNTKGYVTVSLKKGEAHPAAALKHRLIASTFINNPDNKPHIDHINEDKSDNAVSNLRWCTPAENTNFVKTTDARDYYLKLSKDRGEQLKAYSKKLQDERRRLSQLTRELEVKTKQLAKQETKITKISDELQKSKEAFMVYRLQEEGKLAANGNNYTGYKNTTGMTFKNEADMIEATGKKIIVQGTQFPSCGRAADWIVLEESKLGNHRNRDTISKELRRYLQGRRDVWDMYETYSIGS